VKDWIRKESLAEAVMMVVKNSAEDVKSIILIIIRVYSILVVEWH